MGHSSSIRCGGSLLPLLLAPLLLLALSVSRLPSAEASDHFDVDLRTRDHWKVLDTMCANK